jgi:acetolactate synthase small subunit
MKKTLSAEAVKTEVVCELALIRLEEASPRKGTLMDRAGPSARVLVDDGTTVILAATGTPAELEQLMLRLAGFEIKEVVRTGPVSIDSGSYAKAPHPQAWTLVNSR